jgi:hypothetical protein
MIPTMKSKRWSKPKEVKLPKQITEEQAFTIPEDQVIPYSLTNLLITWTKDQRGSESKMIQNGFSADDIIYLSTKTTFGCAFPPARGSCPPSVSDIEQKKGVIVNISDKDTSILDSCLKIACCSSLPWARHYSNPKQAMYSRAVGFLSLYHENDAIYKGYLGQDIVWNLYSEMVTILDKISDSWLPWHDVTVDNRVSSENQLLKGVRDGNKLDPIVGVAIAQNAADVDTKYRKGIAAIWNIVQDMCGIDMIPDSDDEMGISASSTRKIGSVVCNATHEFFQVCVFLDIY